MEPDRARWLFATVCPDPVSAPAQVFHLVTVAAFGRRVERRAGDWPACLLQKGIRSSASLLGSLIQNDGGGDSRVQGFNTPFVRDVQHRITLGQFFRIQAL